ncbi:MAG: hypothetical protein ABSF35_06705 [Polyangia bacterium]|jgi:hypothetical protein
MAPRRIVAVTLADELAGAVSADATQRQDLVDAALSIGQWLADRGYPGRWDKAEPAAILRCLDFLPNDERERFLFSFVGLLGHGALTGQIPALPAKQSIDEISNLTSTDTVRAFARTTAAQLQPLPSRIRPQEHWSASLASAPRAGRRDRARHNA